MSARVTLEPRPNRMAMAETHMRYAVMLDGEEVSELYWNMRGYRGAVPYCRDDGTLSRIDIGEKSLAAWKREVALTNRRLRTKVAA